jgi:UDP-GlcNAc:undecaprenyl-phosphate GlcNAc-1-phosphate transferase
VDLSLSARLAVGIALAAGLAYAVTPVAILAARRFSFYDIPAATKVHKGPTPYLGGAAVMLAFSIALLVGAGDAARTLPLLLGVAALLVVGTIDDRVTVSPAVRVAIELALGAMLAATGLGWKLGAGMPLDVVMTALWVVSIVNAFNLFDNMDGQASTMALVVSAGACALAVSTGAVWAAAGSAALCGACAGFLPHNLHKPAKIFLGDGGSMPLGFVVASLVAVSARSAEPSTLALVVGFMLVGLPALDTSLVIVSRKRRGVSLLTGGQDHLTHRTRRQVGTPVRVALVLGSAQALLSALVVVATHNSPVTIVYVMLGFVVCAATAIVSLENPETATAPAASVTAVALPPRRELVDLGLLALLGLGAGMSPLFEAYYSTGVWTPVGLVLVVAAAAAAIARTPRLGAPSAIALTGVSGLGLWSLISTSWSPAVEQGTLDANRWLVYAAMLLLALVLVRSRRHGEVLLAAAAVGIGCVGVYVIIHMFGSGGAVGLFVNGRINSPLGYINGQGCIFAMGCWPALALAERRNPLQAGTGAALAVLMACLALLSESRGAAIASLAAVLLALVAIPGRRRRTFALAFVAAGVAAAAGSVVHIYSVGVNGTLAPSVVHAAAAAMVEAALLAGLAWGLVNAAAAYATARAGTERRRTLERAATAAAIALIAIPLLAGAVKSSSIEHRISSQWHQFVNLSDASASASNATQSRLFSGSGNRYDYWRVAYHVFEANPLAGAGAGGYTNSYFKQRRTVEAIQNPHSIELEVLSELGLVGFALLLALVGGVASGARWLRRAARTSPQARTLMVAATGTAAVWFVDTSGDWMHLLPGVTAVAISAAAVLLRAEQAPVDERPAPVAAHRSGLKTLTTSPRARIAAAAGVAFVLALAGASLMRTGLANMYLSMARSDLKAHPADAFTEAQRSLRLDSANLDAYYVKAAAQARFDQAGAATTTLMQAVRQDPGNFVTWILLGDLHVRAGDLSAAKRYYARAHQLDPNDPSVADLAANPAGANGSSGA